MSLNIEAVALERGHMETEFQSLHKVLTQEKAGEFEIPELERARILIRMSVLHNDMRFLDGCIISALEDESLSTIFN